MPISRLECYTETSKHHIRAFDYFNFDQLDAFHSQDIISVVYGADWKSVLITEQDKALLHVFSKQRIGDSEWFDIEPLIGYGGVLANTSDTSFITEALNAYSKLCMEENIIAEIVRFNCIIRNHSNFEKVPRLEVVPAKEIVVIECLKDTSRMLRHFSEPCRRRIKRGRRESEFRVLDKSKEWDMFINFYFASLARVHAQKEWYFTPDFFDRARASAYFNVYSVWHEGSLASASLVIEHPLAAYYLLAGNSSELIPGAGEMLISGIAQAMAELGIRHFILGGGNSPAPDDPLLRFKKKFAKTTHTFYIGKMIHNPDMFASFCDHAVRSNEEIKKSNFFLKYRLTQLPITTN